MGIFDVYQGNAGSGTPSSHIIGRVKRVVLGANYTDATPNPYYKSERDLGAIYFEPLYANKTGLDANDSFSKPAYPIFSFIRQYPNVGEIVLIMYGPSPDLNDNISNQDLWYFPTFAIWNSVHHNVFPNLEEYKGVVEREIYKNGYNTVDPTKLSLPKMPQGSTFQERDEGIKSLRPFEGDTIIQGRYGQSIRFGSTVPELKKVNTWSNGSGRGNPITIIVNSQKSLTKVEKDSPVTVENINRDGSSIYLTSGQDIEIEDLNLFPRRSYSETNKFNPQKQEVTTVETLPKSNDITSPADQDKNAINSK